MELPYTVGLEHLARSISGTEAFWSEGETFPNGRRRICKVEEVMPIHALTVQNVAALQWPTVFLQVSPAGHSHAGLGREAKGFRRQTDRFAGLWKTVKDNYIFAHQLLQPCLVLCEKLAVFPQTTRGQTGAKLNR